LKTFIFKVSISKNGGRGWGDPKWKNYVISGLSDTFSEKIKVKPKLS
jgi:hypothetical protein